MMQIYGPDLYYPSASDSDRTRMNATFKQVSDRLLTSDAAIKAEYEKLLSVVEKHR